MIKSCIGSFLFYSIKCIDSNIERVYTVLIEQVHTLRKVHEEG